LHLKLVSQGALNIINFKSYLTWIYIIQNMLN
jgi:hypothetical protein